MKKIILRFSLAFLTLGLVVPSALVLTKQNEVSAKAAPTVITTRSSQSYIDSYYASVNLNQTGDTLKNALATLLKAERKSSFSYGSLQSSAYPYTDVDPNRPNDGYIVSFYSGTPVKGYSGMNKEHTWPNSHGGNKIENDPHVIRPTLTSENSARGNMYYAQSPNPGWDPAEFNNPKYRGISARIIFYGGTIGASSGLIIEDVGRGQGSGTGNKMGKLGDLLKWNLQYPVDQTEIIRNETLDISLNYNRNPFIDDPLLACKIWGDTNAETRATCNQASAAPTAITLNPSTVSINMGFTETLSVSVTPSNANSTVTWESSNPSVATVNNGVVTPVSVGYTKITATSTANNAVKGYANVTVTNDPIPVTGVSLNKSTLSLSLGKTSQLSATVSPSSATNKNVTWSSTNPSVASVSSSGLVTALSLGTSTIRVTTQDGSFQASATLSVTNEPVSSSIKGSFHNNNSTNSSGENGVTVSNINNGISASNALGFGGKTVVTEVAVTQGYFPRSNGLAIGSSSSAGSLKLTLAEAYHAIKVEAKFNHAGQDSTIDIDGNAPTKTKTSGTIGTAGSNPGSGSAYVIEFESPASEITLTTTKRTALVELVIHYGVEDTGSTPLADATTWADSFLAATSDGCLASSGDLLLETWDDLAVSFNALSTEAKAIISGTVPNGDGESIEEAVARYIVIVEKYELLEFIPGVSVTQPTRGVFTINDPNKLFTIIGGLTLFGLVATFFVLDRKLRKN